ncbi:glycoside hydrolase family 2 TIM barrel-domain containing protein [Sphingomonas sp. M1-B02]|uniref:glycoside hydrolase family 2 TIM barrel-domain containing protein n=1 Tax=Sphingomonas sp. M1-B02 TaxID=3114300 RepID=UPI00223ED4D5|nr:glycoside hydrolase family 2 TIM barrel-domain containing protein [Sphingomonas sp. S6-11]UZK64716.1 malectin domain-containing carbohydrate-binding protein [Sphingomonas sp. S6-11]
MAMLPSGAVAGGPTLPGTAAAEAASPRQVTSLTSGWRFRFGGDAAGVTDATFDDSDWERVELPHTWNRLGEYALTRSPQSNMEQGVGWYRLALKAPARARGQRQVIQFDGVGAVADVWVNGVRVGGHAGAFSTFRFDITDQLRPGAANRIVVKADNSKPAPGSATADVIPLGGDFFVHGGIYRGVSLLTVDAAQFDTLDHGGPGIYLSTPQVTEGSASVALLARLRNAGAARRTLTMNSRILDASGAVVASDRAPATLTANGTLELRRAMTIARPILWQGRENPYLYRVVAELVDRGRVVDRVEQPLGVRTFAFDPDKGFILNGKPTPLHGASRHQDRQGKGWALSAQDHAEDMAIMAEMGVNTVRHAHYQHAQAWSDEADKAGMVVKAELPFVHQSSLGDGPPTAALIANARAQLVELIRQNYNHPSVMIWSVGNEIDIGAAINALRRGGKGPNAQSRAMLVELNALARSEDPSRPTAYADCCEATPSPLSRPGAEVLNDVTDVIGLNRYFGWYYGKSGDAAAALGALHAKYPNRSIMLTEYGAGGALTQHSDNVLGGPVNANGRPHPEAFQAYVHEETWKALKQQDYLGATWIWNMFDFASNSREEGDAIDLNDKGLVSYDRKIRKDAFYFYKANWSTEPVLHLTGRRYVDRAYPVAEVRAYSNADAVSLTVNGAQIGTVSCPDRICVWPGVALKAGENAVTATATVAGKPLSDTIRWTAPDASAGLHIRAGSLTGLTSAAGVRFGSDSFFVGGAVPEMRMGARGKPAPSEVKGTGDAELYGSYREGDFVYELPLPDGRWMVTLHMFEPDPAKAATRTFDVAANGVNMVSKFNPAQAAGGPMIAVTRTFPVRVTSGKLSLRFTGVGGPSLVSAIAVVPDKGGARR